MASLDNVNGLDVIKNEADRKIGQCTRTYIVPDPFVPVGTKFL